MSNQPTGEYRLLPWAYPPIPGGTAGGGGGAGSNPVFNTEDARVAITGGNLNYASQTIVFGVRYIEVINTLNVDSIRFLIEPIEAVVSSGTFSGISYTNGTVNVTIQQLENSMSSMVTFSCSMSGNSTGTGMENFVRVSAKLKLYAYDASGNVLQMVDFGTQVYEAA